MASTTEGPGGDHAMFDAQVGAFALHARGEADERAVPS